MGLFDKIKNLLYYEEEVEVKNSIPNSKESIKIHEEPKEVEEQNKMDNIISERDLVKSKQEFKFPIIFEDEDFTDIRPEIKKEEPPKKVEEVKKQRYQRPTLDREVIKEVIEKPRKFTPSPVISPVYGVLDKNYEKGENKESKDSLEKTKELIINFETIRKKAYGTLSDDIEKELSSSSDQKIGEIEKEIDTILEENNLLSDLKNEEENTTLIDENIEQEEDNDDFDFNFSDFGVEYKIDDKEKETIEDDLLSDSLDKKENISENKTREEHKNKKSVEAKKVDIEKTESNEDNKDLELTEDLFNLIDSMYDR